LTDNEQQQEQSDMDFTLSEEHSLIKRAARSVIERFKDRRAEIRRMVIEERRFPQEIWSAIGEAGFIGAVVPEQYGGSGAGLLSYALVIEEMASLGFGNALLILTAMDALTIARSGSDAAKQKFLPRVATGELKLCFAVTESNAGSNTFRIETHAKKDGGVYRINGSKTFITGAEVADYMLLVTRTKTRQECEAEGMPKAYGLSLFMVPCNAPGLTRQRIPTRGIEGMNQWTLFFDDVEVPAEDLIGEEHGGTMALFRALNPERILAAAAVVGVTSYCLQIACDYARTRKVFKDTPIGQHQAVQHPLAEVKMKQEAVRLLTYRAAWEFDRDQNPADVALYTNSAKYLAAELGIQAVDTAMETLGGNGFSDEYGLAHLWEGMRLVKTAPITKEMILNYTAEHALELPRSY
jgi:alkylation response protein AidB-like acyl-CoA dehydrogenase